MTTDWDSYARSLAAAYAAIGSIEPLSALDDLPDRLSTEDRLAVIGQAEFGLRTVYAHLPLKRVRHPFDPFIALKLLSHRVEHMSDREFHSSMMAVFKSLGDIHTSYQPPPPHNRMIAFLPFLVDRYFDGNDPRYVVTRILSGFDDPHFKAGVEVTTWSGVPIHQILVADGGTTAGSNTGTKLALALHFLTVRWLGFSMPPAERWVVVGFTDGRREREIRLPWALMTIDPDQPDFQLGEQAVWTLTHPQESALNSCISAHTHIVHMARRSLFTDTDRSPVAVGSDDGDRSDQRPVGAVPSQLPEILQAAVTEREGVRYGYIRIRSFAHPQAEFVAEFQRLLASMPKAGLIIDIRGNPGGVIQGAEQLLQLLTPHPVTPLGFQFLSSDVTRVLMSEPIDVDPDIAQQRQVLRQLWGASIDVALETGAAHSKSAPLTSPGAANDVGQRYYGPVVLITDAMTYSSGDMFAAGFQDLDVGPVLGEDFTTGGGGANLWSHAQLVSLLPEISELQPLPDGVQMTYAVRRCLRGGRFTGMPVEEFGVRCDDPRHLPTRRDILFDDQDLLDTAMKTLSALPSRELNVVISGDQGSLTVALTGTGLDAFGIYIDGRPRASVGASSAGAVSVDLDVDMSLSHVVTVHGLDAGAIVAASRHVFPEAVSTS